MHYIVLGVILVSVGVGVSALSVGEPVAGSAVPPAVEVAARYVAPALTLLGWLFGIAGAVQLALRPLLAGGGGGDHAEVLERIARRMLLSETAKRIAYREEDLQLIRKTIEDDLDGRQFGAALVLVDDLAQAYGQREEAEKYREKIEEARRAEQEAKVSEAIARFDDLLARREYSQAQFTAAKLLRLYPYDDRVARLSRRVVEARGQYKLELERQFLESAEKEDLDKAMSLMAELDKYLSEKEAEPFRETARGVIGKQRNNLGVQFKMAVHDKDWARAVRVGEHLVQEFPNSRMADEVRGMIDLLRERAAGQLAAKRV